MCYTYVVLRELLCSCVSMTWRIATVKIEGASINAGRSKQNFFLRVSLMLHNSSYMMLYYHE